MEMDVEATATETEKVIFDQASDSDSDKYDGVGSDKRQHCDGCNVILLMIASIRYKCGYKNGWLELECKVSINNIEE